MLGLRYNETIAAESLVVLRAANTERAREWQRTKGRGLWLSNLVRQTTTTPVESHELDRMDCDAAARLTLLDLLPSFMNVTAARSAMGAAQTWQAASPHTSEQSEAGGEWAITVMWQQLAVDFMAQAAAEQRGEPSWSRVVLEAFAWGDAPASFTWYEQEGAKNDSVVSEDVKLRELFFDHCDSSVPDNGRNTWHRMHAAALADALNDKASNNKARLDGLGEFKRRTCHFLESLHESQGLPILAQLGSGRNAGIVLDGVQLSEEEVQTFRVTINNTSI